MPAPDLDVQPADKPAKKAAPKKEEKTGTRGPGHLAEGRGVTALAARQDSTASPQDHGRVAFVVNALVTGAGGFLGLYLVEQLTARGGRVRALCRRPSRQLDALGVETVQADLRDREATVAACRGMDVVFHAAGVAGIGGPWKRYYQSNTLAARHVVEGCRRHGVARLVYTSSPSVTFDGRDQQGVDESAPYAVRWLSHYSHSKALAEQDVLAANDPPRLMTCALRPHLIWGPARSEPGAAIAGLGRGGKAAAGRRRHEPDRHGLRGECRRGPSAGRRRPLARLPRGRPGLLHQPGRTGQLLAVDRLAPDAWPACRRSASGCRSRRPGQLARRLEFLYRLLGVETEPPMTRFLAAQLARSHYYDVRAAREDFGYRPRVSTDEGLRRLAESWRRCPPIEGFSRQGRTSGLPEAR